jgi:toxin ParE1/3/4
VKTRFTPLALSDLSAIARWIAKDRPNASKAVAKKLRAACIALADNPNAYPFSATREKQGVRRVPHMRWAIYYRVEDNGVLVLRILDGARDATDLV